MNRAEMWAHVIEEATCAKVAASKEATENAGQAAENRARAAELEAVDTFEISTDVLTEIARITQALGEVSNRYEVLGFRFSNQITVKKIQRRFRELQKTLHELSFKRRR